MANQINRNRKEIPPYDVTTIVGPDKDGNEKLSFIVEKDGDFTHEEVEYISKSITKILKNMSNNKK